MKKLTNLPTSTSANQHITPSAHRLIITSPHQPITTSSHRLITTLKHLLIITSAHLLITTSAFSQSPDRMSYQAVVRNAGDALVTNTTVGMQISILLGSADGTEVYVETHTPSTNANGLVSIEIGGGTLVSGDFAAIDWADGPYFLKTETDPSGGTAYSITGVTQLLSVPYALYASSSGTTGSLLWHDGDEKVTTSAKVGIGTNNPEVDLEIRSALPNYWAMITIGNSDLSHSISIFPGREGDPNPFIQWKDGDPLRFSTDQGGWSEKMRITSDGNVGIGISAPAERLEVDGNIDVHSHHIINVADPINDQDAATKAYVDDIMDGKVDKVEGKGLSTEDYTTADKTKLNAHTTGTVGGQMLYWNGSAWENVPPGDEGQVLTFVGGVPTWRTPTGDVLNPATAKVWMDRNLGAIQVAASSTDANSYGHLYQWGRGTDGHQLRTSGTTSTLSNSDSPGHGNFIIVTASPNDWRSPQNNNLWQGESGVNNPCPVGYRLPADAEWMAEIESWSSNNAAGAFASPLKLPLAGCRDRNGLLDYVGSTGYYWSSTFGSTSSLGLFFDDISAGVSTHYRAKGLSVRCLKNWIIE